MHKCVIVWIDHQQARIFHVNGEKVDAVRVEAPRKEAHHRRPHGHAAAKDHPSDFKHFSEAVVRALQGSTQILLVGPSSAKLEFLSFVHHHDPTLATRIAGVETVDHPSDGQLLAQAKRYFKLEPQTV